MTPILAPFLVLDGNSPREWRPWGATTIEWLVGTGKAKSYLPLPRRAEHWQTFEPFVHWENQWEAGGEDQVARLENVAGVFVDLTGRSSDPRSIFVRLQQLCDLITHTEQRMLRRTGFHIIVLVDTLQDGATELQFEILAYAEQHSCKHLEIQFFSDWTHLVNHFPLMRLQMAIRSQHSPRG